MVIMLKQKTVKLMTRIGPLCNVSAVSVPIRPKSAAIITRSTTLIVLIALIALSIVFALFNKVKVFALFVVVRLCASVGLLH